MNLRLLPRHYELRAAGRIHLPQAAADASISLAELLTLLACGAVAAATVLLVDFKLKLPGHAILRAVFPMALGLSLVPRRGAGTVMGTGALATAAILVCGGWAEKGLGALTSLSLVGPVLDLAVRRLQPGRRTYLAFIAAGVVANLAAMFVQAGAKSLGIENSGGKPLAVWLWPALVTYPLCGALAGLVSAAVWFRWNSEADCTAAEDIA